MRRGESLRLEWGRVDLKEGLIYLQGIHQKNGKLGSVPLNETAKAALRRRGQFRREYCPNAGWVFAQKGGSLGPGCRVTFWSRCGFRETREGG